VLVHFWSTGCPLCHEAVGIIDRWRDRFGERGLALIAVCQPKVNEAFDVRLARREAREEMRIDHPCALDVDGALARAFGSEFAPSYFVFDGTRVLRHRQTGNARLTAVEECLDRCLESSGYP